VVEMTIPSDKKGLYAATKAEVVIVTRRLVTGFARASRPRIRAFCDGKLLRAAWNQNQPPVFNISRRRTRYGREPYPSFSAQSGRTRVARV